MQEGTSPKYNVAKTTVKAGVSFGTALAMVISYTNWGSIFWAILHGLLSWIYVIYFILFH
ncbi:hypothetical protein LJC49_08885 [Ruminococcaceae bacterium OttesenSCG-928-I18]|nr:hypothetical protein [Ruminococcaceae bacterium OttesenSCG-928-I18]